MLKFTKKDQKQLDNEMKVVKFGDLYKALHYVGDDPVKAQIEEILEHLLDEKTFKTVLSVFNICTDWKQS